MKNLKSFILLFAALAVIFTGCSKDDNQENAQLSFIMVDAPGDYQEVNVEVTGLEVIIDGETIQVDVEPRVYNLLELTGGVSALLGDGYFPAGQLSQIRLILGNDNSVLLEGESEEAELKTPSAQTSGLKLNVHYDLEAGVAYEFILDFNVDKSVVALPNNMGFILKPVIRTTTVAESGSISGTVISEESVLVTASSDANSTEDDIVAYTDETGAFLLYGVPAGTYEVTVAEVIIPNVEVLVGERTDLGEVSLE
ncbi:DUF4382 domain-containing protein [Salinimicrobium terrae]|uniref:DUF4382 domain-containing protein n=1 Tax=Salinimicrobium terrae TaxID=470866 RepID=UPI000425E002|nr:DUF4382 domain-containing protein [Salinimicrobium terrae]